MFSPAVSITTANLSFEFGTLKFSGQNLFFLFSLKLKPHTGGAETRFGQTHPGKSFSHGIIWGCSPLTRVPPAHPSRLWCEFSCPVWVSCPQRRSHSSLSPSEADPSKLERLVCLVAGFLLGVLWLFFLVVVLFLFFYQTDWLTSISKEIIDRERIHSLLNHGGIQRHLHQIGKKLILLEMRVCVRNTRHGE